MEVYKFDDYKITVEKIEPNGLLLASNDQAQEFMDLAQKHLDQMPLFANGENSPYLMRSVIAEAFAHQKGMTIYSDHIVPPKVSESTLDVQPANLDDEYDWDWYCDDCGCTTDEGCDLCDTCEEEREIEQDLRHDY